MNPRLSLSARLEGLSAAFGIETVRQEPPPASETLEPSRPVPVILAGASGRSLDCYTWGIFPQWGKDSVHADSGTIAEHPGYRDLFRKQRCVVPCDGFYGYRQEGKRTAAYRFHLKDSGVFGLAAFYDVWQSPSGREERAFSILKTDASRLVSGYQDWMPAILSPKAMELWLNPAVTDPDLLQAALGPSRREDMTVTAVPAERKSSWRERAKLRQLPEYGSVKP
ncbi:hypothetical protein J31TS4_10090 [Paenibacillus sp. J31TS4]|uniref:SOS response-associated peptidase n=1 Tax=Paenibacillus sp. J31TS4 TaxID=2807195 RepID=UPI001B2C4D6D|nr:SOS response-associated peptidase [Paenibacillus sp. J31TS4]GIP37729.1 hypothetical protein J31TS4_10090 [Paenibacillus sp. J31TS4]